jgi:hypothetical protein
MAERADLRDLLRDNLVRVVPLLVAAVVAPVIATLVDLPTWSRVGAAAAALVSVVFVAAWLPLPWSVWQADHGRRLLFASLPLVVAAGLVAAGLAVRTGSVVRDPRARAMLILLDTSQTMANGLDAGESEVSSAGASPRSSSTGRPTKLDTAAASVEQHAIDNQFEQVGLASFGGSCDSSEPLRQHVDIAFERKEAIEDEVAELKPIGRRNLVAAASNAVSLLSRSGQAVAGQRLVIITGGLDGCERRLEDLIDTTRSGKVDLTWDFVGLGLSEQEKLQAGALNGDSVTVHLADTPSELDEALASVLGETPIRNGIDEIRTFVTSDVRDRLQGADDALDDGDFESAEGQLGDANTLVDSAEDRFLSIETTGRNEVFKPMVVLLEDMVQLQHQDIDLLDQRLEIARSTDVNKLEGDALQNWNDLTAENKDIVEEYNDKLADLELVLEDILEELFGP